jgi:hypothetical protein
MKLLTSCIVFLIIMIAAVPAAAQEVYESGTVIDVFAGDFEYESNLIKDQTLIAFSHTKNELALSPDGKWIAFTTIGFSSDIWIAPSEGGEASILVQSFDGHELKKGDILSHVSFVDPCFSQDSSELFYVTYVIDEAKGGIINFNEYGEYSGGQYSYNIIEAVNIETGETRTVIEGGKHFSFSSDGRYICYIRDDYKMLMDETTADHNGVPTIYDTVTGETRYLIKDVVSTYNDKVGIDYKSIAMSTDNSYIVVGAHNRTLSENNLYRIPFEGGVFEKFGNVKDAGVFALLNDLRFSPDGRHIIFNSIWNHPNSSGILTGDYRMQLNIFNVNTNEIHMVFGLTPPEFGNFASGIWSLAGDEIYFIRSNFDQDINNIVVIDFKLDNFSKITTDIVGIESETPESFLLLSNYPNPFNPTTTIEFTLPETGFTELAIYNMAGQIVRVLETGEMSAGAHSAVWDGRDMSGELVSSGVFISRLKTMDNVVSNRMLLVK